MFKKSKEQEETSEKSTNDKIEISKFAEEIMEEKNKEDFAKVDLEVKSLNDPIPMFPFAHSRVIYDEDELSHTDRAQVKKLWEEEWQKIDTKKY